MFCYERSREGCRIHGPLRTGFDKSPKQPTGGPQYFRNFPVTTYGDY